MPLPTSKTTDPSAPSADVRARCHEALVLVATALRKHQDDWNAGKIHGQTFNSYFGPLAEHQLKLLKILAALESSGSEDWDSIVDRDKI